MRMVGGEGTGFVDIGYEMTGEGVLDTWILNMRWKGKGGVLDIPTNIELLIFT